MMNVLSVIVATVLLILIALGLLRILWGPTPADRMLAAQLFGSTGVAILLLLGRGTETESLQDVALVFALLAVVSTVAFVRRLWVRPKEARERGIHGSTT